MNTRKNEKGFTLLEMLIVITIIGCLATIVTPNLLKHLGSAHEAATELSLNGTIECVEFYRYQTGSYPTTAQGLDALIEEPNGVVGWDGPYLSKPVYPKDAWKQDFMYLSPGVVNVDTYDLWSIGADGIDGTLDDVINWQ